MTICNRTRCRLYRRLLPEFLQEDLDREQTTWKSAIFEHLPRALNSRVPEEIEFWFNVLDRYISFETFSIEPVEIEKIGKWLFDFITSTDDMNLCMSAAALFNVIIKPRDIVINMLVDWRPLYDLLYNSMLSRSKLKVRKYPSKFPSAILCVVQICTEYFSETAVDEMLEEWSALLDPSKPAFVLAHCLFSIFVPVHHHQHARWLPKFIDLWTVFRVEQFDFQFLSLFARLARCGFDDVPWDSIIPYMCNVVSNYLGVPTTLLQPMIKPVSNYQPDLYPAFFKDYDSLESVCRFSCMILVTLMTGKTKKLVRSCLERLFHLIYPFCTATLHAEDETQCEAPIEFLNELIMEYVFRVQKERKYGSGHLEPLQESDHEWIVANVLPLVVLEQFHDDPQFSVFHSLVQLSPSQVVEPVLRAAEYSLQYVHLKAGAYQTLVAIAPTVIHTQEGLVEFMDILERYVPEDLDFMDTQKTSVVFQLLTLVSSAMNFTTDHTSFVLKVTRMIVLFAEHAVGQDYKRSVGELMTTLGCIVRSVPPKIGYKLARIIEERIETLPDLSLDVVIGVLEMYSVDVFGERALQLPDFRWLVILGAMIKKNEGFTLTHINEIRDILVKNIEDEKEKVTRKAILIVKWVLSVLLSIYPKMPWRQGAVALTEIEPKWHVPCEAELVAGAEFASFFTDLMVQKFGSATRKDVMLGAQIGRAVLKGVIAMVSIHELEPELESPLLTQPYLRKLSDVRFARIYERVMYHMLDEVEKPDRHEKAVKVIVIALAMSLIPRDPIYHIAEQIMSEYRVTSHASRLAVMLPPIDSMTHLVAYCKSKHLFAIRKSVEQVLVTKISRNIFPRLFKFTADPDIRVRNVAIIFCQVITASFKSKFVELFEDVVVKMQDPDLDPEVLSAYCGSICTLPNLEVGMRTMKILVDAALAICRVLPMDMIDKSVRSLKQIIVIMLDQTDPLDPRLPAKELEEQRYRMAFAAMEKHSECLTSRETQDYAAALVCSVIVGAPVMVKREVYSFMLSILTTDDLVVRDCVVHMFPTMIESLIPRVPRPTGKKVSEVTAENYDEVEFIDKPFKVQSRRKSRFLSFDELMDVNVVSLYFSDDAEERVAIHRLLFDKITGDHTLIAEFVNNLVNGQVHREETFAKSRILLWSTFCRFFGIDFMAKMIEYLDELTNEATTIAHQVVAAEIFAGILHSLKARPYKDIEKISLLICPFVSRLIQKTDTEFHSLWYFAFYASLTDFDPRRLFWLFDHIITCVPNDDSLKAARAVSLIADILLDVAQHIPNLATRIEEIAEQPLFSKTALESEQIRECSVRALSSILGLSFEVGQRGRSAESRRILDRFVTGSNDTFFVRWILRQFRIQSIASLCAGEYILEHLHQRVDAMLDTDENEAQMARAAFMSMASSNMIGSVCELPLTSAGVSAMIDRMLDRLLPSKHHWQIQSVFLLITETFMSSVFFFVNDEVLERIIGDRVIPGLLHQHTDVQDAASQLLTFIVKCSLQGRERLSLIVEDFKTMLFDRQNVNKRIAGAKGLTAVISGTVLFDDVPDYVIDSFTALTDALEIDTSVTRVVRQFFADFWAMYDNNLSKNVVEVLAPFRASLRPSYIC